MSWGQTYRVGTFQLQCSTGWVDGMNPKFSLQNTVAIGKTACLAVVYVGSSYNTTGFFVPGSGDGQLSTSVNVNVILTSVPELVDGSQIEIYPNPSTSSSILQLSTQLKNAEVVFYDILGKEMVRKRMDGDRMEIEKGSLESGVYFVRVMAEEKQWVQKIVVE